MNQSDIYARHPYENGFIIESVLGFTVVLSYEVGIDEKMYQVLEVNGEICVDRFADRLVRQSEYPIAFKSLSDAECAMPMIVRICERNRLDRVILTNVLMNTFISVAHSSDRQFGWNWVDSTEGYEGFMDDYGTFIPEWVVMP